jgi:hypothetical protein
LAWWEFYQQKKTIFLQFRVFKTTLVIRISASLFVILFLFFLEKKNLETTCFTWYWRNENTTEFIFIFIFNLNLIINHFKIYVQTNYRHDENCWPPKTGFSVFALWARLPNVMPCALLAPSCSNSVLDCVGDDNPAESGVWPKPPVCPNDGGAPNDAGAPKPAWPKPPPGELNVALCPKAGAWLAPPPKIDPPVCPALLLPKILPPLVGELNAEGEAKIEEPDVGWLFEKMLPPPPTDGELNAEPLKGAAVPPPKILEPCAWVGWAENGVDAGTPNTDCSGFGKAKMLAPDVAVGDVASPIEPKKLVLLVVVAAAFPPIDPKILEGAAAVVAGVEPNPPPNIEVVESLFAPENESDVPKILLVFVAGAVEVGEQMLKPWNKLSATLGTFTFWSTGGAIFSAAEVNEKLLAALVGALIGGGGAKLNVVDTDGIEVVAGGAAFAALNAAPNENEELVVAIGFLMSAELTTAGDAIVGGFCSILVVTGGFGSNDNNGGFSISGGPEFSLFWPFDMVVNSSDFFSKVTATGLTTKCCCFCSLTGSGLACGCDCGWRGATGVPNDEETVGVGFMGSASNAPNDGVLPISTGLLGANGEADDVIDEIAAKEKSVTGFVDVVAAPKDSVAGAAVVSTLLPPNSGFDTLPNEIVVVGSLMDLDTPNKLLPVPNERLDVLPPNERLGVGIEDPNPLSPVVVAIETFGSLGITGFIWNNPVGNTFSNDVFVAAIAIGLAGIVGATLANGLLWDVVCLPRLNTGRFAFVATGCSTLLVAAFFFSVAIFKKIINWVFFCVLLKLLELLTALE